MKQLRFFSITLFALLLAAGSLAAQVTINPKVGVNYSGIDAKLNDINAEARVGWNAGVDFRLSESLIYLQPGAHFYSYTARLLQEVDDPEDVQLSEETQIQNIRLPVNLGIRLTGEGGILQLHAIGGVTPSYVLGVNEKEDFAFDKDSLRDWTFGANVGLGLDILFLTANVNYEIGLTDFFEAAEGRNNMLTLSVGVKF